MHAGRNALRAGGQGPCTTPPRSARTPCRSEGTGHGTHQESVRCSTPPSLPPSAAGLRGSVVTHLAHEPAKGAQAHLCERVGHGSVHLQPGRVHHRVRLADARLEGAGSLDQIDHRPDLTLAVRHAKLPPQPALPLRVARRAQRHQRADDRRRHLPLDEVLRLGLERLAEALQVDDVVEELERQPEREEVVAEGSLLRGRRAAEHRPSARAHRGG
mmetsp:Transcript_16452/g.49898  ORF Transcript_16452/g.49898 Transcript_16452/m.49898 type:complete len:215 (-) Transcript_16452:601-1245(-)